MSIRWETPNCPRLINANAARTLLLAQEASFMEPILGEVLLYATKILPLSHAAAQFDYFDACLDGAFTLYSGVIEVKQLFNSLH